MTNYAVHRLRAAITLSAAALILAAISTIVTAAGVLAQTAAPVQPAVGAEGLKVARQLLQITSKAQRFDEIVPLISQQLTMAMKRRLPAEGAEIDRVMKALVDRYKQRNGEMVDRVAPLYAQRFSVEEMRQAIGFYSTPVGQRILTEMPNLMQQSMTIGMTWGQQIGREIAQDAQRELAKKGLKL